MNGPHGSPACRKFEDTFRRDEPAPAALAALREHAAVCSACAEKAPLLVKGEDFDVQRLAATAVAA